MEESDSKELGVFISEMSEDRAEGVVREERDCSGETISLIPFFFKFPKSAEAVKAAVTKQAIFPESSQEGIDPYSKLSISGISRSPKAELISMINVSSDT